MGKKIVLENVVGWIDIEWPVPGSELPGSVRLDIDLTAEKLVKPSNEAAGDPFEWARLLKETLVGVGIPAHLSHHQYHLIARTVWDASEELRKKDEATRPSDESAGSLGTTSSTPSI